MHSSDKKSNGLNEAQKEAVAQIHGPVLVFAGAGSGKTTVITQRIARMIKSGIAPSSIVAVTFTNKSAREMKERTVKAAGKTKGMIVSTFHSLGNRLLAKHIETLEGYRHPFSILSPEDAENIYVDIYKELKMDPSDIKQDSISFLISLCKNSGLSPEDFARDRVTKFDVKTFTKIYDRYSHSLRSMNSLDFDDLILLPAVIFKKNPRILADFRKRHRYFLVDEFQDTNPAQYDLLRLLVGPDSNICVVGDDDQSIYGWRGADVAIIRGFQKDYPGAKIIRLELNYRSQALVLKAANAVIRNNAVRVDKTLIPVHKEGEKLGAFSAENEEEEAIHVVERIRRRIARAAAHAGDFAILFRTNFQSRVFEQELRKRSIPYHVVGGYRFFDRREVKDMIAYIRFICNEKDEISLMRIINRPKRGIGEAAIRRINEYLLSREEGRISFTTALKEIESSPHVVPGLKADTVSSIVEFLEMIEGYREKFASARKLSPVLASLVKELDFEREFLREGDNAETARARMMNVSEVVNMLAFLESSWDEPKPPSLFDFLARVSLMANDEDEEPPSGKVQLLTLHLSKGLEFPVVFLTGMEDGLFPSERALAEAGASDHALAEERRLFYVGITRAKDKLYLSLCRTRKKFGNTIERQPSRFLDEVPEDLVEWEYRAGQDDEKSEEIMLASLKAFREN